MPRPRISCCYLLESGCLSFGAQQIAIAFTRARAVVTRIAVGERAMPTSLHDRGHGLLLLQAKKSLHGAGLFIWLGD
jgi:hypothetical protein